MITITRKVQIRIDSENKKEDYQRWRMYSRICQKAANMITTSHFVQENIKDLFFFEDGTKKKLGDIKKDKDGILNMSAANTTYQLLSKLFKGDCPMGMLSGLNQVIVQSYKKEAIDVKNGKKSLRSYRSEIPMPVRKADISNWVKEEDGNYSFHVYGTQFYTNFGKDLSGNELIVDGSMKGDYKLCDSSIKFDGKKMFALLVFQIPEQKTKLNPNKEYIVKLGAEMPVIIQSNKTEFSIGTKEEYLHRVSRIRQMRYNASINARYSSGGKGRKTKLAVLDRYSKMEANYVTTKIHQYTYQIVEWAVKNKIGKITIKEAEENNMIPQFKFNEILKYKCKKFGIEFIIKKQLEEAA